MTVPQKTSLREMDLLAAANLIKRQEVSPVELVEEALHRAETEGPLYNAYVTLIAEQARAKARAAEKELLNGGYRGPLHGVPLSIKDLYWTRGVRTTAGSRVLSDFIPDEDATVVSRIDAAGGILIAKANTYQFACSPPIAEYGPCRNPWNLKHTTRGSSCGSAAAVAAGLDYGSFGSDTGGSIRVPSAFTGIVGLKPSFGVVSRHRMHPVSWTLDHAGPMARSVGDAAALLEAVIGLDPNDPASIAGTAMAPSLGETESLTGIQVGVLTDALDAPTTPKVAEAVLGAGSHLQAAGATVREVSMPGFIEEALRAHGTIMWTENRHLHSKWYPSRVAEYSPFLQERLAAAEKTSALEYLAALQERDRLRETMRNAMAHLDLLLLPASPFPATLLESVDANVEEDRSEELTALGQFNSPFNLTGQPALTVPYTVNNDDLPIGVQLVGREREDLRLLSFGRCLEKAVDFAGLRTNMLRRLASHGER
jgi:aspartyl-tRNA(Asn)/glutamyl-tRNA(Gln) amidotransferase subunit A